MSKSPTDFAALIYDALKASPRTYRDTHWLAANVFPGRWTKRKGRGALTGHVDRAATGLPHVYREPGKDQHEPARFIYIPPA